MKMRDLLGRHDFRFKKKFGQNFIVDRNLLQKIAGAGEINKDDVVLEIGPGAGTLTRELSLAAGRVVAVEIDKTLVGVLEEQLSDRDNVEIVFGDALKEDLDGLVFRHTGVRKYKVVANLPYYITSPLVMHLLENCPGVSEAVVMVQLEVAERMTAEPGGRVYGGITAALNLFAGTEICFRVPRRMFHPVPDVDSAVMRIKRREKPLFPAGREKEILAFIRISFAQRRKKLTNNLKNAGFPPEEVISILGKMGMKGDVRAEMLSASDFVFLYEKLSAGKK